jgi:pimeloyl-ACP methyl ester carboxylesterase
VRSGQSGSLGSSIISLPRTGQTTCYDATGSTIACTGTGQDGELLAGVAWPNPRFTDNSDQTVTDNLTGLIWAKDGNVMKTRDPGFDNDYTAGDGAVTWQHALDYIKKLNQENYLGHNDWRLPNRKEFESLLNAGQQNTANWLNTQGYSNVKASLYWSSSTYASSTYKTLIVNMGDGSMLMSVNKSDPDYVWPVRSGQSGSLGSSIISLPRTGQTTCYDATGSTIACTGTGQDGELLAGVAWPNPRFTDKGDQTVTDNLTGLNWTKDGIAPGPSACSPGSYKTWQGALDYVKCLNTNNYLGHNDWRLPNRKELESLVNTGQPNTANWLYSQGYNVTDNGYWSSSTSAYGTSNAWFVDMYAGYVYYFGKSNYFYVWPVRSGQSGTLGNLIIFEITKDTGEAIGPQNVNAPFNIKITAKDGSGNVVTSVNGYLSLSASIGGIAPMSPLMQSGVAVVNGVWLFSPGNITIQATLKGYYGSSSPFIVYGATNTASVRGKVLNGAGDPWVGAIVHLEDGGAISLTTTADAVGKYAFTGLVPSKYTLWAEDYVSGHRSIDNTVNLGDYTPTIKSIEISNVICNPSTLTPILLVPGIMGSSVGGGLPYPILPKGPPNWQEFTKKSNSWGLHDPRGTPGWRDLVNKLQLLPLGYKMGCTIFPVPYDWRMDINDAAREYLKKWIDEAKRIAGTSKVNIIAHSMGGLVTRAYIQSIGFDNDIDRFAMVGTPNHGSALTYYMVEGGEPGVADAASDMYYADCKSLTNFYAMTSELMYWQYSGLPPLAPVGSLLYRLRMNNLYDEHIISAAQLLPTYGFLNSGRELEYKQNDLLPGLNSSSTMDRMGNSTNKVITKLFAGNGSNTTLNNITVGQKDSSAMLYKDGQPLSLQQTSATDGDGTVPLFSASLGLDLEQSNRASCHADLLNTYSDDIVSFITSNVVPYSDSKTVHLPVADGPAATNEVSVVLFGRARILVTDLQGRRSGIQPTTGEFLDEIPGSDVAMDEEKAIVSFSSAADGIYVITVTSAFSEDYRIYVSYLDSVAAVQKEYSGFNQATTTRFTFTVTSATPDKITINLTPLPPTGLQADAVASGGSKTTRLTWAAGGDPTVVGYNVYSKNIEEPYLAQIGISTTGAFDTGHPWAENSSITTRIYAVSAVKSDGTESFFSNMVQNDDPSMTAVYADFPESGIWKWDGTAWSQVTQNNPQSMAVSGSILYGNFGAGAGIWKWDGAAWTQVTPNAPTDMAAAGSSLYGNFGTGAGIWKWDGTTWSQVTPNAPTNMMGGF